MKGLIFTLGLSYGGLIVSLFRPWYGLLIYVCFSTLRPDTLWFWSVEPGPYTRTIAIGLIFGWALNGFGTWNLYSAKWPLRFVIGYWLSIVWSAVHAPYGDVAWNYVDMFTKIILPLVIGFSLLDTEEKAKQMAWVWMLSLGFVGYEANLDWFLGGSRLYLNGFFGTDNNSSCIALVTGIGLAFFLGLAEKQWWKRLLAWGIAGMLVHCPMFGESRGGMLGVCAMAAVTFVVMPKRLPFLMMYAVGIVVGVSLAGPSVRDRFLSSFANAEQRDASAQSRVDLWKNCWQAMMDHPWYGLGPDHFPIAAKEIYGWGRRKEAHMLWLNAGAELGFPGLFFLLSYYLSTMLLLFSRFYRRRFGSEWQDAAARGVIVSLCGFIVSACFVAIDALEPPYFLVVLGAGLLRVCDHGEAVVNLQRRQAWEDSVSHRRYGHAVA